jgi:hypothetical protein
VKAVDVHVALAGDLNLDGEVDGADSALFEQAFNTGAMSGDIDGDGRVNAADRQALYANFGLRTNQAPALPAGDLSHLLKTHTDLGTSASLDALAPDLEGDAVFWKVLGASNGSARLAADGQTLIFTPEAGFSGHATITVQADDGFAVGAPIELGVDISGAALVMLQVQRIAALALGGSEQVRITADFADEAGVAVDASYARLSSSNADVLSVQANGTVRAKQAGIAMLSVRARGIEGISTVTVDAAEKLPSTAEAFDVDVYPRAIDLPAGTGQRQLKVTLPDHTNISSAASGTRYYISNPNVAEISPEGLILAKAAGLALISVVNGGMQHDIVLRVEEPTVGSVPVSAADGAAVEDAVGNLIMVAPGALQNDAHVSISGRGLDDLGIAPPLRS